MVPADLSSEESGRMLKILYPILSKILPDKVVTDHLIRKCAHFSEYAVLGMELSGLFSISKRRLFKDGMVFLPAWLSGFLIAFIDETIQIFSSGRGAMIADVWLDSMGALTGILLILLMKKILKRRSRA